MENPFRKSISNSKERRLRLLETGELADCKFIVGVGRDLSEKFAEEANEVDANAAPKTKIFNCHRMVLATASEVFERMLYSDFLEKTDPIRVTDIQPDVFELMLKYIYTYELDLDGVTLRNFKELFYVADKYMMIDLSNACIQILKDNEWELENIFPIYETACLYGHLPLLLVCYEKICMNSAPLLTHWTFIELDINCMKRLMVLLTQNNTNPLILLSALERYERANGLLWKKRFDEYATLVDAACCLKFPGTMGNIFWNSYLFKETLNEYEHDHIE